MKNTPQNILEYLFKLIDIQIKKYVGLSTFGVGPDAKMNAALVEAEVRDLLYHLNEYLTQEEPHPEQLRQLTNVIKLYIDCEYIRGYAGWLIDENEVHNTGFSRMKEQRQELYLLGLDDQVTLTEAQEQCLHDSHAIAHLILDLAMKLKENPDREDIDDHQSQHGLRIMRRHAREGGRYYRTDIAEPLRESWEASSKYLNHSKLQKRTDQLDKPSALASSERQREQFNSLLKMFLQKYPGSELARPDFAWYELGTPKKTPAAKPVTPVSQSSLCAKIGIFAVVAVVAATVVGVTQGLTL